MMNLCKLLLHVLVSVVFNSSTKCMHLGFI